MHRLKNRDTDFASHQSAESLNAAPMMTASEQAPLRTLLTAIKFVIIALLLLSSANCKKQNHVENQKIDDDLNYPMNDLSDFWSTPMIPDNDSRAIGFHVSGGLFVLWEQLEGMPMTQLHSAYGTYRHVDDEIYLSSVFCSDYKLEIKTIDGVEVLIPQGMSADEAKKSNWFLIHREGACSKRPFSYNLTKFDGEK